MHEGVAGPFDDVGGGTHFGKGRFAVEPGEHLRIFRLELDASEDRTVARWMQDKIPGAGFLRTVIFRRRSVGNPEIGQRYARATGALQNLRSRFVRNNHGNAVFVMTCDNTAKSLCHYLFL